MRSMAFVARVGLAAVGPLLLGLVLGLLVDRLLDTSPWGTLLLAVVGSSLGMAGIWRLASTYMASMAQKSQEDKEEGDNS